MKNSQFWIDHFSPPSDPEVLKSFFGLNEMNALEVFQKESIPTSSVVSFESAENKVFGSEKFVVKFYRPGRWSYEALQEEVEFLKDL